MIAVVSSLHVRGWLSTWTWGWTAVVSCLIEMSTVFRLRTYNLQINARDDVLL